MKETDIEILRQIVSRTDKTGNEKVEMLIEFVSQQVKKINEPAVSKCEEFEREASCKHSDWTDLYYSSGDYYGRYCNDCGEFFE